MVSDLRDRRPAEGGPPRRAPVPTALAASARQFRVRTSPTLSRRFDPRHNSLSVLRLGLAATVALVHAQALGWRDQPYLGRSRVGDLAVDAFFVISGFLVTRSATRLPSFGRFLWHRALRILPGFWACLIVTALAIAPLLAWIEGVPLTALGSSPDPAAGYVVRNAALLIRQWNIAGLARDGDTAMNGSLWTLFYEAVCYLLVGALVATGALRRHGGPRRGPAGHRTARHRTARSGTASGVRRSDRVASAVARLRCHLLLAVTVLAWALRLAHVRGADAVGSAYLTRFALMFLLGALAHVYAHRIRFPLPVVAGAAALLAVSLATSESYRLLGGPAFAYLVVWLVVALPLRWEPRADLSYGLYVYHWPIELVLVELGLAGAGRALFTGTALLATTGLAVLSWRFVEAPALVRKDARLALPVAGPRPTREDDAADR